MMRRFGNRIRHIAGAIVASAFLVLPSAASAHERWFVDERTVGEIPALFREPTVAAVGAAAGAVALVALLVILSYRRRQRPMPPSLAPLVPWIPTVVGIAMGVSLVLAAFDRTVFAPDLVIPDGPFGTAVVAAEIAIGILLALGFLARAAAGGVLALSILSFAWYGFAAADYLLLAGVGVYLLVWGRGRLSLGSVFGRVFYAMDTEHLRPLAVTAFRVLAGATFVILGSLKISRPDLNLAVLDLFPKANPYSLLHAVLPFLTRDWYVLCAAAIEIGGGVLLAAGAFIRPVCAVLLVPFLVFPFLFGAKEIPGHLPIVATLLGFLVMGKGKRE